MDSNPETDARTGEPAGADDAGIARRRWRNMMIASEAAGGAPPEQRRRLEAVRRELGIPFAEASAIIDAYRREGGGIQLFGDRGQRVEIFRDILSMLLADGRISEKEKNLILLLAKRLSIGEEELDRHIEECRDALREAENRSRRRMSSRVYRRTAQTTRSDGSPPESAYEEADEETRRRLRLSLLESLAEESQGAPPPGGNELDARYRAVREEDEAVAQRLVTAGVATEPQMDPFRERQEDEYRRYGRVVSFLTLMVRAKALGPDSVQVVRNLLREARPAPGSQPVVLDEGQGLVVRWRRETLDQSFFCSVIEIEGQADHHNVPLLQKAFKDVQAQEDAAGRLLILDMTKAEYISSAAIGAVIEARARVLEEWGDLRFVGLTDAVREVIELLGVDSFIVACEDVSEALWSFADFAEKTERGA